MDFFLIDGNLPPALAENAEDSDESESMSQSSNSMSQKSQVYTQRSMPFFLQTLQVSVENRSGGAKPPGWTAPAALAASTAANAASN